MDCRCVELRYGPGLEDLAQDLHAQLGILVGASEAPARRAKTPACRCGGGLQRQIAVVNAGGLAGHEGERQRRRELLEGLPVLGTAGLRADETGETIDHGGKAEADPAWRRMAAPYLPTNRICAISAAS